MVLPQTHLNSLAAVGSDVYAGTADDAVLYRIDGAGKATALYQATNAGAAGQSITIQSGGQTQVISVAPSSGAPVVGGGLGNPLLRRGGITGGNEITAIVADENGAVYFGTLGGSSVYRYTAARGVEEYWKAATGAIYSLTQNGDALYAGCDGGAVWRLSGNIGDVRARRAGGRVVTVSIEAMRFLHPVEVGDEVSCYCSLERHADTSLAVKIETWSQSRDGSEAEKVTEGVFTYVAVDESGKPRSLEG